VEYSFVLSAGSVCEGNDVLEAPLELVAECVYSVLDLQRLLDKKPVSLEEQVEALEDGLEAALENDDAVTVFLRPLSPCDLVRAESKLAARAKPFRPSPLRHKRHGAKRGA
jgi:hypothetical protein